MISPSDVVNPNAIEDDTLTETQSYVSEGESLATASPNTELTEGTHPYRRLLPRRRDTLGEPRIERKMHNALPHPCISEPFVSLPYQPAETFVQDEV